MAEAKTEGLIYKGHPLRRIDDLGRVVIPKEIRRTLKIREGDPLQTTWTPWQIFCFSMLDLAKRGLWNGT